jgi:precorrin-2 dehydrogenase / sirohydrochlorin ferrochelatase
LTGERGSVLIPLFLDLKGKSVVVFGGGAVGQRKAAYLAKEAEVTIVDRSPGEAPAGMKRINGEAMDHLHLIDDADIVVAATDDPEVNEAICRRAREVGAWYNRAEEPGNFLIPSVIQRRNFTVAVSTEGRSPGMSRHLREHLDSSLPRSFEDMVDLTERMRTLLKESVPDPIVRERAMRKLVNDQELWSAIEKDPLEAWELAKKKAMD